MDGGQAKKSLTEFELFARKFRAQASSSASNDEPSSQRMPPRKWASTLRLPKSAFPPRAVIADRPKYLTRCTDDLYSRQRKTARAAPSSLFRLHDGPPYANGSLHIGHALNKILKDITCRYQVSRGKRVEYIPGWDCHGLPIEIKALQRRAEESDERTKNGPLSALDIRRLARELASATIEEQKAGFREWAVMADWNHAWKTMDKGFELRQLDIFKRMVEKGLIYRKHKPVYWSPSSKTALAEAELEYREDHLSTAAFVKFPLHGVPKAIREVHGTEARPLHAVIWTTTPWTLLSNKAIAVHSDLEYVLVDSSSHGLLVLEDSRLEEVGRLCREDFASIARGKLRGSQLVGCTYQHPAFDSNSKLPILHGAFVSADSGSGLVHVAPGHGMDDYRLCLEHGIESHAPVDDAGCFTNEAMPSAPDLFVGKDVLKSGNLAALNHLSSRNAVIASHKYKHKYPYDWRSKQPVIIRATQQWFADVGGIREATLASLSRVQFIPDGGRERLASFIRGRSEWCISRQRAWGVPIPALYDVETDVAVLTPDSIDHIASVIQQRGTDAWWSDDEYDMAWIPPSLRDGARYRRGRDTMDVWFDSGTSWSEMEQGSSNGADSTADVYLEGSDQHRGWFQSSLLTKIAHQSTVGDKTDKTTPVAPFKTLITHGFILDYLGKKMSKSEGNVISPKQIMDGTVLPQVKHKSQPGQPERKQWEGGLGPDALRLWVAGNDYTRDVSVGIPVLQTIHQSLLKLRVTFKLLTGLLDTHRIDRGAPFTSLNGIDQMALIQLRKVQSAVLESYDNFDYHRATAAINQYVNAELSAVYVESIKDRLYADATDSRNRVEAQMVLWEIFTKLSRMLAPITPLLVEEACDYLPPQLTSEAWNFTCADAGSSANVKGPWVNEGLEKDMAFLSALNAVVKSTQELARGEKKMGSSLQSFVAIQLPTNGDSLFRIALERRATDLADLFVVSGVNLWKDSQPPSLSNAAWCYSAPCEVQGHSVTVQVYEPEHDKCVRCWKYHVPRENPLESALCRRCVGVLEGIRQDHPDIFRDKPNLDATTKRCRSSSDAEMARHWDFSS